MQEPAGDEPSAPRIKLPYRRSGKLHTTSQENIDVAVSLVGCETIIRT